MESEIFNFFILSLWYLVYFSLDVNLRMIVSETWRILFCEIKIFFRMVQKLIHSVGFFLLEIYDSKNSSFIFFFVLFPLFPILSSSSLTTSLPPQRPNLSIFFSDNGRHHRWPSSILGYCHSFLFDHDHCLLLLWKRSCRLGLWERAACLDF